MRKVQQIKPKKSHESKQQHEPRAKKDSQAACMSAPNKADKGSPYQQACKNSSTMKTTTNKRLDINSAHGRHAAQHNDATSRFSSCTAKTSPSTDNNSNDNCHGQDAWDKALQAKICEQDMIQERDQEPLTPSRMRASSDNTQLGGQTNNCSPTGNRPIEKVREIKATASANQISTGQQSTVSSSHAKRNSSKYLAVGPAPASAYKATQKRQQAAVNTRGKPTGKAAGHSSPQHLMAQVNEQTGGRITTPYPGKYKTVMCRYYNKSETCPYGVDCNYAHGKS